MEVNGKKVVDATSPLRIKVTPRDAKLGANKDPGACAAARAAKREVPNCISARVHLGRVYIEEKNRWIRYKTPDSLRSEIIAFDRGGEFDPGEYELLPPSPADRLGARTRKNKDKDRTGANSGKRARKMHVTRGVRKRGANR